MDVGVLQGKVQITPILQNWFQFKIKLPLLEQWQKIKNNCRNNVKINTRTIKDQ
jgi:hypothetical protein